MTRKKIGLALSGGGARGFAHLGVLKVLEENNIPIDFIAGTSAGAIVGAAFAAGMTVSEIIAMGRKASWFTFVGFPYSTRGLLSNAPMGSFLKRHLPANRFEDLKIPFAAVTCDLETGEEVVFRDHGDLVTPVLGSCAIPGVFVPVKDETGRRLIDGGAVAAVPTRAAKEFGADVMIAVDVISSGATYWGVPTTPIGVLFQSAMLMLRVASKAHHYRADVVIVPEIAHLRPDDIGKMDEFIAAGETAANAKIDEIRSLAVESN